MRNLTLQTIWISAWLVMALPAWAEPEFSCYGRLYPAKVVVVYARSAKLDIDLGFGLSYRGVIDLYGTVEPKTSCEEWYGKASEALRQKLIGKPLTLCVINEGMGAIYYAGTENVNQWMIEKGFLPPLVIKENITTDF